MKWIVVLCISAVIGTGLAVLEIPLPVGSYAASSPPETDNQPAHPEPPKTVFATGFVEGARREVPLSFELEGRVVAIDVSEGDIVKAGDVLARLDATLLEHRVRQAEAALARAEAERERVANAAREETRKIAWAEVAVAEVALARARAELQRGEQLLGRKAISEKDWDNLQLDYKEADAQLRLAQAKAAEADAEARRDELKMVAAAADVARSELSAARAMLEKATLVAPSDGLILRVVCEPGQIVGGVQGAPLITMADVSQLRVRAYVEELDALQVQAGQRAEVAVDGRPGVKYNGTVVSSAPYLERKNFRNHQAGEHVDVRVREVIVALAEGSDLVVGLPADVFIALNSPEQPEPAADSQP